MISRNSPIGVFDSGVGGISILKALRKELPCEDFIFYGDNANAPYGEKDVLTIRRLSEQCFLYLRRHDVKATVIACNTATSAAAGYLREKYPDDIIVAMEPAVKPASRQDGDHRPSVLVMATESTLSGERLKKLVHLHEDHADIHTLPAPGLVRLVEGGKLESKELSDYLKEILAPYRQDGGTGPSIHIDSLVLGCTHFPFARKQIREALGYSPVFYDGAEGTAKETRRRLAQKDLLSPSEKEGTAALHSSRHTEEEMSLMKRLWESSLDP